MASKHAVVESRIGEIAVAEDIFLKKLPLCTIILDLCVYIPESVNLDDGDVAYGSSPFLFCQEILEKEKGTMVKIVPFDI